MNYKITTSSYFDATAKHLAKKYPSFKQDLLTFRDVSVAVAEVYACSLVRKARAYMRICFTMETKPLERVGERCSFSPIFSIK